MLCPNKFVVQAEGLLASQRHDLVRPRGVVIKIKAHPWLDKSAGNGSLTTAFVNVQNPPTCQRVPLIQSMRPDRSAHFPNGEEALSPGLTRSSSSLTARLPRVGVR